MGCFDWRHFLKERQRFLETGVTPVVQQRLALGHLDDERRLKWRLGSTAS